MCTLEQAFFNYYPQFYNGWIKQLMSVCDEKGFTNIKNKLSQFPHPDNMHVAMTRMEYIVRMMEQEPDAKVALIRYMGKDLSYEELQYIMDDTVHTEKFKSWRRIFQLLFFIQ